MNDKPHPRFSADHCANCEGAKDESWHLLCDECFHRVPSELSDELVQACKEKPNSRWHHWMIDTILSGLEEPGRNMPNRPGTLSDGSSHYVNRGECAGPFGEP